ncbi:MAG: ThuA domain-containing protein [Clostridia bacterium]|nr:ThuA domain-containing protein [Clostridia bacterium]
MAKKAVILGTYVNAPYHPFQGVDKVLRDLIKDEYEVELTDKLERLQALRREGVSLLISYLDAFDTPLPEPVAEEIEAFVLEGEKLLCLHNGISLQTSDRLYHLIGGKFLRHPPQTELSFTPAEEGFLAGCEGFAISEEPYQFEMSGENVTPVLNYVYDGKQYLGGWLREVGHGRIVFLTPGHSLETFRVPQYLDMISRSIQWLNQAE